MILLLIRRGNKVLKDDHKAKISRTILENKNKKTEFENHFNQLLSLDDEEKQAQYLLLNNHFLQDFASSIISLFNFVMFTIDSGNLHKSVLSGNSHR